MSLTDLAPIIRHAGLEDIPGLVDLFSRYYSQDKPDSYFQWQFFSQQMPAQLIVAVVNNKVVGSFGLMPRVMTEGLRCAQAMDMLLDKSYRGGGLFSQMVDMAVSACSDVDILVVLANQNGMRSLTGRMGWKAVSRIPVYTTGRASSLESRVRDELDCMQRVTNSRLRICYDQATEYWRFEAHPINRYYCLTESGVRGYLKVFADPADCSKRFGDIMHVMPCGLAETLSWLKIAHDWFRGQRIQSYGLWSLPGSITAEAAELTGLIPRKQERWLCIKPLQPTAEALVREMSWDVCAADAEFY